MNAEQMDRNFDNFFKGLEIDLRTELVDACPVDTGGLKGSIKVDYKGDGVYEISMLKYGEFVEFGTSPHIIRPKNKQALFWKGAEHPVKLVNHPGTRPNPFIRNTIYNKLSILIKNNFERHFK
jgi:hypothetical protein